MKELEKIRRRFRALYKELQEFRSKKELTVEEMKEKERIRGELLSLKWVAEAVFKEAI